MIQEFVLYFSIAFIIFCIIVHWTNSNSEMVFVNAVADGQEYMVRNLPDKQQAAELLASLRSRMQKLIDHVYDVRDGQDEFCEVQINQLKHRFRPDKIAESPSNSKLTSFSVDKGAKIFLCLRNKSTDEFIDLNTLIFVNLHEIVHVMTTEIGHTGQFWANFKYLLREAIKIGVYKYQDFSSKPVPFCGITITSSPFNPVTDKLDLKSVNTHESCR